MLYFRCALTLDLLANVMMCGNLIAQATYLSRYPTSGNGVPRRGDPWRHPWYREICYENKFKQIDTESAKTCFKLSSFVLMSVFKLGQLVLSLVFFHHLLWKRNLRDTDVLPVTLSTASKHWSKPKAQDQSHTGPHLLLDSLGVSWFLYVSSQYHQP